MRYFPENPALRLEVWADPAGWKAHDGDADFRWRGAILLPGLADFGFDVEGHAAELTIFKGPNGLFLPFVDSQAGSETYLAGRYLEPEPLPGGRYLVDFNYAYNPYCAYNAQWSCPLTPLENRLEVADPRR